jgi:hypothetical protein
MLATIELDDEHCIGTRKIHHKSIYWDLAFELKTRQPTIAQAKP